jgi:hypothetical protein
MAYAFVAYASHAYGFVAPVFPFALVGAFVLAFPVVGRPAATGETATRASSAGTKRRYKCQFDLHRSGARW